MPTTTQNIVRRTWRPPEGAAIMATAVDKHYNPWGITIYRTCYSPGSDQQWSSLLKSISTAVSASLSNHEDQEENPDSSSIISKTFKLDARSDFKTLNSLTMDQVSQLYCEESGGSPMKMLTSLNPDHKIFLLADEEVLRDLDSGVIKVVQASPNENVDPECFFQWMRIRVRFLVDFWINLENSDSGLWDFIYEEQPGAFYSG